MKITLGEALHARPANLFVRVASTFPGRISVCYEGRTADAKNILQVLTLGAAKGAAIEIVAEGDDAEHAHAALALLVERNFDSDLVPETGSAMVPGLAVGRAVLLSGRGETGELSACGVEAATRLAAAFAQVRRDLTAITDALPAADAALFEPEIAIIDALVAPVIARVTAGVGVEEAIRVELAAGHAGAPASDLLTDARDRLTDAFLGDDCSGWVAQLAEPAEGDVVLVVRELTPSIVAACPHRVSGIVALSEDVADASAGRGYASHAAILARGRGIPLLFVGSHVFDSVAAGDVVVLDTRPTPPRFWPAPGEARIADAHAERGEILARERSEDSGSATQLTHLVAHANTPFAVRVNLSSLHDRVPAASDGAGLVRTELLFAGRTRAPSSEEQFSLLLLLAGKLRQGPLVVRLFDAGGDKPTAWLARPQDAEAARGIELLLRHPQILRSQVDAISRLSARADARLLIPMAESVAHVEAVRALVPAAIPVGVMIETPRAVALASSIASAADFVCIGTNDLHALVRGEDRNHARTSVADPRVLDMVSQIVSASHAHGRAVTVCGEMAADPDMACVLVGMGVDAISVAPARFAAVHGALVNTTAGDCRERARSAMKSQKGTP